jgi:thiol-disulfide isomerase/thioredoxin
VKSKDCQNAVDAILAGKKVELDLTKPMGCSTKWREKKALHDAKHEAWAKTPVTVEAIDKAGIAALRANKSNKYRMINVWATWCAPCVKEFPDLVEISRKFDMRDFELVTISMDDPKDKAKAEAFLFKQAAGLSRRSRIPSRRKVAPRTATSSPVAPTTSRPRSTRRCPVLSRTPSSWRPAARSSTATPASSTAPRGRERHSRQDEPLLFAGRPQGRGEEVSLSDKAKAPDAAMRTGAFGWP